MQQRSGNGISVPNLWQDCVTRRHSGITELLPISSTAHMRVVPALLGWSDPGSAFSAAMQLAALAAVISYFLHTGNRFGRHQGALGTS